MDKIPEDIIDYLLRYIDEIEQLKLLSVNKLFNNIIKNAANVKKCINRYFVHLFDIKDTSAYKNSGLASINIKSNEIHKIEDPINSVDTKLFYMYADAFKTRHNVLRGKYTRKQLANHFGKVGAIDFDDKKIMSGSADSSINIYDTNTGNHIKSIKGHTLGVRTLTFNSQLLFTGSYDRGINIWDSNTFEPKDVLFGHNDSISRLVISKYNPADLYSIGHDGVLNKWDINTGKSAVRINIHDGWANALVQYDANIVISGGIDEKICIWDLREKKLVKEHNTAFYVRDICINENNIYVAGRNLLHFDFRNNKRRNLKPTPDTNRILTMSMNQQYITVGFQNNDIKIFDIKNDKFIDYTLQGHTDMVMAVKSDDEKVISGGADNKVYLWSYYKDKKIDYKHAQNLEIKNYIKEFNKIANKKNHSRTTGIYHRPGYNFNIPAEWMGPVNTFDVFDALMNKYYTSNIIITGGNRIFKKQRTA
jgi:WD40 repeat protein